MRLALPLAVLSSAAFSSPASAQVPPGVPNPLVANRAVSPLRSTDRSIWTPREAVLTQYVVNLNRLRAKALQAQAKQGGTLNPKSRMDYQRELDVIDARYRRRLHDSN